MQDFLGNLRSYEAWRGSPSPPHHVRDAMLKVATQFKVAGKVNGKKRKPEDIGQELEVHLLEAGKRMLAGSAAKPVASRLRQIRSRLEGSCRSTTTEEFLENLTSLQKWKAEAHPSHQTGSEMRKAATAMGI